MTQHPPLYYVIVGNISQTIISIFPSAFDVSFDGQLWLYRLVSLLLVAPLPLLTYVLARLLTTDRSIQFASAAFPLMIPGLHIRNGAMINNDNLLLLLITLLSIAMVRIAAGDLSKKTTIGAGVLTGSAVLTKGLAIVMPPALIVAFAIAFRRRIEKAKVYRGGILTIFAAFISGGWWLLRNVVKYGSLQPSGQIVENAPDLQPDLPAWLLEAARTSAETFIGGFVRGPFSGAVVFWGMVAFLIVGIIAGLLWGSIDRVRLWLVVSPLIFLIVVLMYNSASFYIETGLVRGENGRYLYPWLAGIAVAIGGGYVALASRAAPSYRGVQRSVTSVFLGSALLLQWGVSRAMLERSWGPRNGAIAQQWDAVLAWAPFSREWVITVLLFAVIAAFLSLALAFQFALTGHDSLAQRRWPSNRKPAADPVP